MTKKTNNNKQDDNKLKQLTVAFGAKRAKKIIGEIRKIKADNPGQGFSFVFAEDGSFKAVPKKQQEEEDSDVN